MRINKRIVGFIFVLVMCLSVSGCELPTICVGSISDPKDTVTAFFDSVCKGDFESADVYLGDTSICMNTEDLGDFETRLMEYLHQSYSYQTVKDPEIDGMNAVQKVIFTHLDLNLLTDDLRSKATELGKSYMVNQDEKYTVLEDGVCSLTDEGAEMVSVEALDYIMTQPKKYYTSETFFVELKYSQKSWHVLLSNELFEAIVGQYNVLE